MLSPVPPPSGSVEAGLTWVEAHALPLGVAAAAVVIALALLVLGVVLAFRERPPADPIPPAAG